MEKIAAAALKVDDRVYTGVTHFMAMRKIIQDPSIDPADLADVLLACQDGFVTDTGRYVTRDEAFVIANAANQIKPSELNLHDPEKNKDFYQTDKPSLDSGMVMDSYAEMRVKRANIF